MMTRITQEIFVRNISSSLMVRDIAQTEIVFTPALAEVGRGGVGGGEEVVRRF